MYIVEMIAARPPYEPFQNIVISKRTPEILKLCNEQHRGADLLLFVIHTIIVLTSISSISSTIYYHLH